MDGKFKLMNRVIEDDVRIVDFRKGFYHEVSYLRKAGKRVVKLDLYGRLKVRGEDDEFMLDGFAGIVHYLNDNIKVGFRVKDKVRLGVYRDDRDEFLEAVSILVSKDLLTIGDGEFDVDEWIEWVEEYEDVKAEARDGNGDIIWWYPVD